jgi:hypothetical protein
MDDRPEGLLAWQWSLYPEGHRNRVSLLLHVLTVPLFMAGTISAVSAAFTIWWRAPAGLGAMALAFALQGVGHGREQARPVPFRGPLDVLGRIFVEQWVTFPRYLFSGRWLGAWRGEPAPPRA